MDSNNKKAKKRTGRARKLPMSRAALIKKKFKKDPELRAASKSAIAFAQAWKEARDSGEKVVVSENGAIIEISPDGRRKILKRIEGPKPAQIGRRYTIR